ncbi:concanavalin A-like lectin/glucanase domain-containing protein [Aspergillus pseudodeflectus]|uniref:Concanavalin A-like lectin/glucanase domain-containing protein n=1 Tax=Aspergillus pseudodeflectus TaxID=176178 RepID=A0ABR4KBM9_9EURO
MLSVLKVSLVLAGVAAAQDATYAHRIYHDFRSLNKCGFASEPANITTDAESAAATVQSGYLTSDAWINDFGIQVWGSPASKDAPIRKLNSNANVYIHRDASSPSSHLTLRAYRNENFISSAEVESKVHNMFHASIRVRARVRGDAGVCAGIFTYYDDNNESDIEILTRDPTNHIRYTNQPGLDEDGNEIPGASVDAVMAGGAVWNEWNDHRLDWTEDLSVWYLNGELVHNKTYGVPSEPSLAILNMWGNGGVWTGEMDVGAAAYLDIEWIEILYNTV